MTPRECAAFERMFGYGCATAISVWALYVDGPTAMIIAGGSAAAAAGVGSFFALRSSVNG